MMHTKDVTEILRVLEKRITKLESRVSELESKADEHTASKGHDHTLSQGMHDTMDTLSSRTVSYDQGSKIVFDKKSILDHRKILQTAGRMEGYSRIVRTPTLESVGSTATVPLEDGEIYEGKGQLESPVQKKERPARKTSGLKAHSPSDTNIRTKRGNGRERSKSEPTGTGTVKDPSAPPASKTEMHYGLVVQFPAEG